MKNILIIGSLPKKEIAIKLYNSIIEVSGEFAKIVKSPIDTVNFSGTDKERYKRAFQLVKNSDLIISEQSHPSTGQGMEIRECTILNKPLIIVVKEGNTISGLVKACPNIKEIIYYKNLKNLKIKLKESILSLNI